MPIVTRLSGTAAGSSMPTSRSTIRSTTRRPRPSTTFPMVPVCQPMTETVVELPSPVYQPVSEDSARSRPKRNVSRPPSPAGRRSRRMASGRVQRGPPSGEAYDFGPAVSASRCGSPVPRIHAWPDRLRRPLALAHPRKSCRSTPRRSRATTGSTAHGARRARKLAPREALGRRSVLGRSRARRDVATLLAVWTLGEIERVFGL